MTRRILPIVGFTLRRVTCLLSRCHLSVSCKILSVARLDYRVGLKSPVAVRVPYFLRSSNKARSLVRSFLAKPKGKISRTVLLQDSRPFICPSPIFISQILASSIHFFVDSETLEGRIVRILCPLRQHVFLLSLSNLHFSEARFNPLRRPKDSFGLPLTKRGRNHATLPSSSRHAAVSYFFAPPI